MSQLTVLATTKYVDVDTLRNVFVAALFGGVGITTLFAVAARALSGEGTAQATPRAKAVAAGCLLVVAVAVAVGIWAVLAK